MSAGRHVALIGSVHMPLDRACPHSSNGFRETSEPLFANRPACGGHFLPRGSLSNPQLTLNIWSNVLRTFHSTLSWKITLQVIGPHRQAWPH